MTRICIAGSTHNTTRCAQALQDNPEFKITGIITPAPKILGRKKILTPNPLHTFATEHQIPTVLIQTKIDDHVKEQILALDQPEILLVVDFGYIIKQWLLDWPSVAPINIHPSDLPKYRGSSPGQFVLLFGETTSAVTVMTMDALMDHGPIITKIPFAVDSEWTAREYYDHAFSLIYQNLTSILTLWLPQQANVQPQPDKHPTPIARMLTREDGYVPRQALVEILSDGTGSSTSIPFLDSFSLPSTAPQLYSMWRGLTPWPGIWTIIIDRGQELRLKLLTMHLDGETLILDEVQLEGETKKPAQALQYLLTAQ